METRDLENKRNTGKKPGKAPAQKEDKEPKGPVRGAARRRASSKESPEKKTPKGTQDKNAPKTAAQSRKNGGKKDIGSKNISDINAQSSSEKADNGTKKDTGNRNNSKKTQQNGVSDGNKKNVDNKKDTVQVKQSGSKENVKSIGDKNNPRQKKQPRKNELKKDTGSKNNSKTSPQKAPQEAIKEDKKDTNIKNISEKAQDTSSKRRRGRRHRAGPAEEQVKRAGRNNPYPPDSFSSVEMMSSLKGFAPMGMLFVLMDILKGHEEGLIHVNQLAQALDIGKPSLFAQLENLEDAGLLRTISSSRAGRHIELLTPNLLRHSMIDLFPSGTDGDLLAPGKNVPEAGGQFSQKRLDFLHRYLKDHGVSIVSIPDEGKLPQTVPQIATYMGKYLPYILPFYNALKATLNEGEEFRYSLAQKASRTITHTLEFCRMLKSVGFLSEFAYRRSQQYSIIAKVNRSAEAINFLTGGWLEHYIRDKVISILTTHPATLSLPYAFMKNPNIVLPGGENFELDFLLCVGEKVFWIEAKTGEYMTYLPKYARVSKLLGLGRTTSMLVSVESLAPDDNLTIRHDLSCCNIDEFPDVFRINLVRELQQEAVQRVSS